MVKRKWIFGSLCLAIGILVGHVLTRAESSTARLPTYSGTGIPLAITSANLPAPVGPILNLTDVTFCHKISSFGNYLTYERDKFCAGQDVLIYAEIDNLQSEQIADGNFRTVVKSTIEIFRDGELREPVERTELPETVDLCRRHRQDYFHSYQFTIPDKLTQGSYVLRLAVQDQLDHREVSRSLAFSIK